MTVVRRGDVYLVELDPTRGSELKKTRPAVIIQNDVDNRYSPVTIIAPRRRAHRCSLQEVAPPLQAAAARLAPLYIRGALQRRVPRGAANGPDFAPSTARRL